MTDKPEANKNIACPEEGVIETSSPIFASSNWSRTVVVDPQNTDLITASIDKTTISDGAALSSITTSGIMRPQHFTVLEVDSKAPKELLRFSNVDGKLVVTGDLTRGSAALAVHLSRTMGFPLPERPKSINDHQVLVAKFTVDGIYYILPVAEVEREKGLAEIYDMAGAGKFEIELFYMSAADVQRQGEFDGF